MNVILSSTCFHFLYPCFYIILHGKCFCSLWWDFWKWKPSNTIKRIIKISVGDDSILELKEKKWNITWVGINEKWLVVIYAKGCLFMFEMEEATGVYISDDLKSTKWRETMERCHWICTFVGYMGEVIFPTQEKK